MVARIAGFAPRQGALLLVVAWLAVVGTGVGGAAPARGGAFLPVYLSESHAGTFFFLAGRPLAGSPCTLVLIDAHDDANAVFGSDTLRQVRRSWRGSAARARGLADWRRRGVIQCFDWIEPLMPDLVGRVVWVPAGRPGSWRQARLARQARARLDACEEAEPRGCGELGSRWRVTGLPELATDPWVVAASGPVVVSVDLDFFAGVPDSELAGTFQQTWETVLALPGLRAVTFAVSAPWQPDRARAEWLTALALEAATAVVNARVEFDPFADFGPDRSRRGQDGPGDRGPPPSFQVPPLARPSGSEGALDLTTPVGRRRRAARPEAGSEGTFDLTTAGPDLQTLVLQRRDRLSVPAADEERWRALLDTWAAHPFLPAIRVDAREPDRHDGGRASPCAPPMAARDRRFAHRTGTAPSPSWPETGLASGPDCRQEVDSDPVPVGPWRRRLADPDGAVRVRADEDVRVRLANPAGGSVRWFAQVPVAAAFNIFGEGFGFAEQAPRWVRRQARVVAAGSILAGRDLAAFLDPGLRAGSVFLWAEVDRDGERWRSDEVCLAVRAVGTTGFRAALSELFGRPYVFGAALLRQGGRSGPDLAAGADCATFLIDGLRRVGWRLPWTDPARFSRTLESLAVVGLPLAADVTPDGPVSGWPASPALCLDGAGRPIPLSPADLETGLFLHLGRHMAAVWEDRPPLGLLDVGDLAAHQLEDLPRVIPLHDLVQGRKEWRVLRWSRPADDIRLVFGGDVMLGRRVGEAIDRRGLDPFAALAPFLTGADRAIVNLEAVPAGVQPSVCPSDRADNERGSGWPCPHASASASVPTDTMVGVPLCRHGWRRELPVSRRAKGPIGGAVLPMPFRRRKPTAFVATPATSALLARAGIDLVSLANNHAGDHGPTSLAAAIRRLDATGIATCGAGEDPFAPASFEVRGTRFAVFGFADGPGVGLAGGPGQEFGHASVTGVASGSAGGLANVTANATGNGFGGGATAEERLAALTRAMRAVPAGTVVIVFVHWGDEHRAVVSDRQRRVADALVAAGARLIVGSGPHVVQPLGDRQGVPIAWSLGNLVFDGPGPDPAWSRGALLEATFGAAGRCVRARHLFVRMADDGRAFPEPDGGFRE